MRDHDYSAAAEFLVNLYGKHTEHAVEIRALPQEAGQGDPRPLFTRNPQAVRDHCLRFDGPGRAVYFGVATRRIGVGRGDRSNCVELPALWIDIDCYKVGVEKAAAIEALQSGIACPASVVVDSGGGIYGYWLLREALDLETTEQDAPSDDDIKAALLGLTGILAGDTSACDVARILRLPGTHNWKTGEPRLCRVVSADWDRRYEFADLQEMLDWHRPVLTPAAREDDAAAGRDLAEDNPFLAAARAFSMGAPLDVKQALEQMQYLGDGDRGIHQTQLRVTAALVNRRVPDDEIVQRLLEATQAAAYPQGERWNWKREEAGIRRMIEDWKADPRCALNRPDAAPAPSTAAPVIQLRRQAGQQTEPQAGQDEDAASEDEPDTLPGGLTRNDIGNAMALLAKHGKNMRYVGGVGWHVWDGKRYAHDPETIAATRLAHDVSADYLARASAMPSGKARASLAKWAIQSGNRNRVSGMLDQARSYVFSRPDELDQNPMLLNCRNGTLDLADDMLRLREHAQADLLTKLCAMPYLPSAACPIWERFLLEIFDGDEELVAFVQRALGYSLTGQTKEQVIFICHGTGSNGKSVLLETVAAILADYMKRSPAETWISKPVSGGPSNDIAALAGARFVSVIETEHDHKLAEALVKQATGGDTMTARFLHREFFTFTPTFKLWFSTNHKPRIRGADYAIWRRIMLLPFRVTFADEEQAETGQRIRDPNLRDKLVAEYPGILAWMIRGCQAWIEEGLRPPQVVMDATEGYKDSSDNVSAFVRDACHVGKGIECELGLLFAAYENWCEEYDEELRNQRAFALTLEEMGFSQGPRRTRNRTRRGIDLRAEFHDAAMFRRQQPKE